MRFQDLLRYDAARRALALRDDFGAGLGCRTIDSVAEQLARYCEQRQMPVESVAREYGELLRYRALLMLIPSACVYASPREAKPIIRRHLEDIGVEATPELITTIKLLCDNIRSRRDGQKRKFGISDVRVRFPHIYSRIMDEQGRRCRYCGIGLRYGDNATLDHVVPHQLGDDPPDGTNWCFACLRCNRGKSDLPYYSLARGGVNWIDFSGSDDVLGDDVRLAALVRDGRCLLCGARPTHVELMLHKVFPSGCWVLDNVRTACAGGERCSRTN